MKTAIRKVGNSSAVLIPRVFLKELEIDAADELEMVVDNNTIIIRKTTKNPRAGWAQASAALAQEELVWPEFANADDEGLEW